MKTWRFWPPCGLLEFYKVIKGLAVWERICFSLRPPLHLYLLSTHHSEFPFSAVVQRSKMNNNNSSSNIIFIIIIIKDVINRAKICTCCDSSVTRNIRVKWKVLSWNFYSDLSVFFVWVVVTVRILYWDNFDEHSKHIYLVTDCCSAE